MLNCNVVRQSGGKCKRADRSHIDAHQTAEGKRIKLLAYACHLLDYVNACVVRQDFRKCLSPFLADVVFPYPEMYTCTRCAARAVGHVRTATS
jgi:hypothetical protein